MVEQAGAQREKGHIDIANSIADYFCRYRIPGQEWQVLWVVLRMTWGYALRDGKGNYLKDRAGNVLKRKTDRIPVRTISQMTGLPFQKCHVLLSSLVDKGIIKKSVTQKGDGLSITYGFDKHFEQWKVSPKKVTIPQKGDGASPKTVTKASPLLGTSKEKRKSSKKTPQPEALRLSGLLADLILQNYPNHRDLNGKRDKTVESWAEDIDLLIRKDNQTPQDVEATIRWCQADSFWWKNIKSGSKLRAQWDTLRAEMISKGGGKGNGSRPQADPIEAALKKMRAEK
ncbi:MAG: hypothetical protein Kow0025_18400 [Thermodesulfovibrionales bacterium]